LISQWKKVNGGSQQVGKRVQIDKHWTLLKREWEDRIGQIQKTELDLALNTYHYTSTVQYEAFPHHLRHVDVKVLLTE